MYVCMRIHRAYNYANVYSDIFTHVGIPECITMYNI